MVDGVHILELVSQSSSSNETESSKKRSSSATKTIQGAEGDAMGDKRAPGYTEQAAITTGTSARAMRRLQS